MSYLRKTGRTHEGNVYAPAIDGQDVYAQLVSAMEAAKRYIYLTTWAFDPDVVLDPVAPSPKMSEILLAKARTGVEVKVLTWNQNIAISPIGSTARLIQPDLRNFQRQLRLANRSSESDMRMPQNRHLPSGRRYRSGSHHQKFWIMDDGAEGAVGFVGGINLGQHEWDTSEHRVNDPRRSAPGLDRYFAELMAGLDHPFKRFLLRELIISLLDEYVHLEELLEEVPMVGSSEYLKQKIKGSIADLIIENLLEPFPPRHDIASRMQGPVIVELLKEFRVRWQNATTTLPKQPAKAPRAPGETRDTVQVGHTSHLRGLGRADAIWRSYRHAVRMARQYIYLENQYFVSRSLAQEVIAAMRRHRDVIFILVLPNKAEDFLVGPAISNRQRMLVAAVKQAARQANSTDDRVFVYTPMAWNGAKRKHEGIYVHAKIGIIDDRWMTIGSANGSARSFSFDTELNTFLDSRIQATAFRKQLWAEHTGVPESDVENVRRAIRLMKRQVALNDRNVQKGSGNLSGRFTTLQFDNPSYMLTRVYENIVDEFL